MYTRIHVGAGRSTIEGVRIIHFVSAVSHCSAINIDLYVHIYDLVDGASGIYSDVILSLLPASPSPSLPLSLSNNSQAIWRMKGV